MLSGRPRLPPELTDRIIDFLHNDHLALSKCSLTCSSLLPTSRLHRFTLVRLDHKTILPFYDQLSITPSIAAYVRVLVVVGWDNASPYRFKYSIRRPGPSFLSSVLERTRFLHELRVYDCTLRLLPKLPQSLTLLELCDVRVPSATYLVERLSDLPKLDSLLIDNIDVRGEWTGGTDHFDSPPVVPTEGQVALGRPLTELHIVSWNNGRTHHSAQEFAAFCRWLISQDLLQHLHIFGIDLAYSDADAISATQGLLYALGQSLVTLELKISNSYVAGAQRAYVSGTSAALLRDCIAYVTSADLLRNFAFPQCPNLRTLRLSTIEGFSDRPCRAMVGMGEITDYVVSCQIPTLTSLHITIGCHNVDGRDSPHWLEPTLPALAREVYQKLERIVFEVYPLTEFYWHDQDPKADLDARVRSTTEDIASRWGDHRRLGLQFEVRYGKRLCLPSEMETVAVRSSRNALVSANAHTLCVSRQVSCEGDPIFRWCGLFSED